MAVNESQISVVIASLLEATGDKDEKVRSSIISSLRKIAKYHLSAVIESTINHRRKHSKLNIQEVRYILNMIKDICQDNLSSMDDHLVSLVIDYALEESLKQNDVPFNSADILTTLGSKYYDQIYERVLKYMKEDAIPQPSIIYIIGNLSVVNIHAFLPFSKSCFDYMLSVLPSIKIESLRKLYANSVAQLVEAVLECISIDQSSIAKENYSSTVEEIFETFANIWLQTKDNKVCEAVVRAMGIMILLFSSQKLRDDTSRILNIFLGLYKKPATLPRYVVTQGISNLLSIVPRAALQPLLDNLSHTLHVMVWITPDFAQPLTVKNHSEVLRCYDYIGILFEEKLCEIVLRNLRSASEQDKVVGLIVATHLLTSSEKILKPKIKDLISILHSLLNESSVKINRSLVKIIVALAYREYLMDKDSVFIEFLVKHCYHVSSNHDLEDLESMCSSTIYLLSTSVSVVQHLCWKVLLKVLVSGEHNQAAGIFAKSLAYLVSKCDAALLEKNCYERSETVFVRVIALLGSPLHQSRGIFLLNFLNHYVIWKVKVDIPIWKHRVSQLLDYLEESKWSESEWENLLFDALSTAFIDDSKTWLISVNTETSMLLTERLNNVDNNQNNLVGDNNVIINERAMLYKMLAFFTQYIDEDTAVNSNIEKILSPIHQRSLIDLKACSRAIGILSKTNLNHVLKQLELLQQSLLFRKTTKFLGLLKDSKSETDVETVRRMICECYSEILTEAPPRLLLPKLKQLSAWFISQMQISKDSQTKNACLEALLCASEILLKSQDIYDDAEECRKNMLSFIVNMIDSEKNTPNVTALGIFTTLFKLSISLPANEKLQILQKCLNKLFQYYCSTPSSTPVTNECKLCDEDPVVLHLCHLIKETVNANSSNAEEIIMFLQPWLSHRIINLRMVSMYLLKAALNYYVECFLNDTEYSIRFNQLGPLLGRIYVRTFEDNQELGKLAKECIILLLAVLDCTKNESVKLEDIHYELSNVKHFTTENSLIGAHQKFSSTQLSFIIESLINGLLDANDSCCLGTANLLTTLFTGIGSQFNRQALDIFSSMLLNFPKIANEDLLLTSSKALISLAAHHNEMFVRTVVKQSLPFHPNIIKIWHLLSDDEPLADEVLKILLEVIKTEPMYDEDVSSNKLKKISARPLAAISSMLEILTSTTASNFAVNNFVDTFSTFFISIPRYKGEYFYGCDYTNKGTKESTICILPSKLILDTLLVVMERAKCSDVDNIRSICNYLELKKNKTDTIYFELIKSLTRSVCNYDCDNVAEILNLVNGHLDDKSNEIVRSTVAVFFAEVLNTNCKNHINVVETVVNSLLNLLNDTSPVIRENSLKGLASLSMLDSRVVEQHKEKVLSALMEGLNDTQASIQHGIILQSLIGLSKLLSSLKNDYPDDIFILIAIGMKPFFEKENSEIRSLSLKLFGELSQCVSEKSEEQTVFGEQVHSNLICLLFHLAEKEHSVSEACKYSLKETTKFLKSSELISVVEKHLADDTALNYNEFRTQFIRILGQEFPNRSSDFIMTAMSYSKSNWPEIRAVAATFIGLMYKDQVEEVREKLPLDFVSVKLLILLKDNDAVVRANAAVSLGLVIQATYHLSSENQE